MADEKIKCPMCGRIKAVEKKDEREYYCNHCQMMFDPTED
jgi:ribosomal protein L37AE/L43A